MTIYYSWQLRESSKTYCLVFNFQQDNPYNRVRFLYNRPAMTWAPTHIELGLIGELLFCANSLNGIPLPNRLYLVLIFEAPVTIKREDGHIIDQPAYYQFPLNNESVEVMKSFIEFAKTSTTAKSFIHLAYPLFKKFFKGETMRITADYYSNSYYDEAVDYDWTPEIIKEKLRKNLQVNKR